MKKRKCKTYVVKKGKKNKSNHQAGLTLIELLLVLVILSILVVATTSNWRTFFIKNKANTTIDQLYVLLLSAKAKAKRDYLPVIICSSLDNKQCLADFKSHRLLVFVDHNNNNQFDGDDEIIQTAFRLPDDFTLSFRGFPNSDYLKIEPVGFLSNSNGTLTLCNRNHIHQADRALIISQTGMVRYAKDLNGDGFFESSSGKRLTCA